MKKIILFLFSVIAFASCKKDFLEEDPKGRVSTEGFFKSSAELKLALTGMYAKFNETSNIDDWDTQLMGGDDVTSRTGSNKEDFVAWDVFNYNAAAERVRDAWTNHYDLISAANFVINGYQSAVGATERERTLAAGQAHFARAFGYYYIVRVWNRAPLVTKNEADYEIYRSNPEDIYALIIADLKRAEELLPANWDFDAQLKGIAPTIGAAKSMLASVYLTMAGYPVKDATKYALAADKAKEVLDNAGTYGYSLVPDFANLWRDNRYNSELVFGLIYNNASSTNRNSDRNIRAPYPSQPEDEGGWADYFAELNFYNNFPAGPRKDATFQTTIRPNATTTYNWDDVRSQHKHPAYKKMRAANGEGNLATPWVFFTWNSSRTNQVIRFAEVKLIYAEAKAMSTGVDASAYKQVNDVRDRAGLAPLPTGLSQTAFRDAVVQERAWEFAGLEFCARWHDLVRLERVETANANRHPNEIALAKQPTKNDYFSPIPLTELQLNPNLGK